MSSGGQAGRVSGILATNGGTDSKRSSAAAGDTVMLGKLDTVKTCETLTTGKTSPAALVNVVPAPPVLVPGCGCC